MAKGDYGPDELNGMARRAADRDLAPHERAKDALRVAPQLTASELQFCIAFRLDPFSYLAAKLAETDAIAAEREERVRIAEFYERERRQREAWAGSAGRGRGRARAGPARPSTPLASKVFKSAFKGRSSAPQRATPSRLSGAGTSRFHCSRRSTARAS